MTKDVAIVGASSAGLFTANLLAQKGLDVKVFEAKDSLNHSPRTLIVTSYFETLADSIVEGTVVNTPEHSSSQATSKLLQTQ
jgi:2-polyprenyl-6-methoxyphenol hydroxylase-like FAD-dependent oxidoreductase